MASSPTARNSPAPLRAVLFDADHTLLDTSKAERCALRAARREGWFDVVVTSEACGFAKPDPRILRVALQALGVAAAEALYVGDDREVDGGAERADYNPASGSDLEGKPWTRPS